MLKQSLLEIIFENYSSIIILAFPFQKAIGLNVSLEVMYRIETYCQMVLLSRLSVEHWTCSAHHIDRNMHTGSAYHGTSNINLTLIGNAIVAPSGVVGASPDGVVPPTSLFPTQHLASVDWAKITAGQDEKKICFVIWCGLYYRFDGIF